MKMVNVQFTGRRSKEQLDEILHIDLSLTHPHLTTFYGTTESASSRLSYTKMQFASCGFYLKLSQSALSKKQWVCVETVTECSDCEWAKEKRLRIN